MNNRNHRIAETNRIKATARNAVLSAQTTDMQSNHVHGFRSLGFYQCARELPAQQGQMTIGSGYNNGNGPTAS